MNLEYYEGGEVNSLKMDKKKIPSKKSTLSFYAYILAIFCFTVCFLIPLSAGISMFVMGIINMDECPVQPKIPKYLIASGFLITLCTILFNLTLATIYIAWKRKWDNFGIICCVSALSILYLVSLTGSLICLSQGTANANRMDNSDQKHQDVSKYCDKLAYNYSYFILPVTLFGVVMAMLPPIFLCCYCSYLSCLNFEDDE